MFTVHRLALLTLVAALLLGACGRPAPASPAPSAETTTAVVRTPDPTATAAPTSTVAPTAEPTPTVIVLPEASESFPRSAGAPPADYVELALAQFEAGTMTEGEALIAALKLFAGEPSALEIPEGVEIGGEGSRLAGLVQHYLLAGDDPAAKAELERLVRLISPSEAQLLSIAAPEPAGSSVGRPRPANPQGTDPALCRSLWAEGFPPGGTHRCLLYAEAPLSNGAARVFYPAGWQVVASQLAYARYAMEAVLDSDARFSGLGRMGPVDVVFTLLVHPDDTRVMGMVPWSQDTSRCQIILYPRAITDGEAHGVDAFKQTVAHEMFHCFQTWNIPGHTANAYPANQWWVEGTAEYFSNVVYPAANAEWGRVAGFDEKSANTPLYQLSYENTVYFQHLGNALGDAALVNILKSLPAAASAQASADAFLAAPGVAATWHTFATTWADRQIRDTGGGYLPNQTIVAPEAELAVAGNARLRVQTRPLLLQRYLINFEGERSYTVDAELNSSDATDAIRAGGAPATWAELPVALTTDCDDQPMLYVLTSAAPGAATRAGALVATQQEEVDCGEEPRLAQTACDHPYLPLREGATWTYSGDGGEYTWTVDRVEGDLSAATAYMTHTDAKRVITFVWDCLPDHSLFRWRDQVDIGELEPMFLTLVEGTGAWLVGPDYLDAGTTWSSVAKMTGQDLHSRAQLVFDDTFTIIGLSSAFMEGESRAAVEVQHDNETVMQFAWLDVLSKPIVRTSSEVLTYVEGVGLVTNLTGYSVPK